MTAGDVARAWLALAGLALAYVVLPARALLVAGTARLRGAR